MNWLLFILRLVFGLPATESSDSQRVAIRPDGSTIVLPADTAAGRRQVKCWGWLLQHSLGRNPDFSVYSVSTISNMSNSGDAALGIRPTRKNAGGGARQRIPDECRN